MRELTPKEKAQMAIDELSKQCEKFNELMEKNRKAAEKVTRFVIAMQKPGQEN